LGNRIEDHLSILLKEAEKILKTNRNQVLALAHALETYKTLSGEDVSAVIEGVQGSIIDGRPYRNRAFLAKIERYHKAALVAHRDHQSPDVPIPVL
jgi:cell division protease FtsH